MVRKSKKAVWRIDYKRPRIIRWQNINNRRSYVQIGKSPFGDGWWFDSSEISFTKSFSKRFKFKNKTAALKFARAFMKKTRRSRLVVGSSLGRDGSSGALGLGTGVL